jgi:L,D-transpeptidase ErfK/SrfK
MKKIIFLWTGFFFFLGQAEALQFELPPPEKNVFGQIQFAISHSTESFATVARRYDVGYYELVEANPYVNPDHPKSGTVLIIPTEYILPPVPRVGIVINLANMRLYYFPKGKNYFYTYPVGIGKMDWETPLGALRIIQKIKNPVWVIPRSILEYRRSQGEKITQTTMLPGPDNPLGDYAIRLSIPTYLIHGTNNPDSVGRRSSAGCIHLYPEDIAILFKEAPANTTVLIINQPILLGWNHEKLYMEAHVPLAEQRKEFSNNSSIIVDLLHNFLGVEFKNIHIQWSDVYSTMRDHTGIPQSIAVDQDRNSR